MDILNTLNVFQNRRRKCANYWSVIARKIYQRYIHCFGIFIFEELLYARDRWHHGQYLLWVGVSVNPVDGFYYFIL